MLSKNQKGLAAASAQLDQKLFAAGIKHTPTIIDTARSIDADRRAKAAQAQIDNTVGAGARKAVTNSYFGGAA